MGDISKNFSFYEFEASETARKKNIDNTIPESVKPAIRELTNTCLQPLRDSLCAPLEINSGYRCAKLNDLLGGAKTSQHRKGEAADIRSSFFTPIDIARSIVSLQLPFDQLILYPTFVHVSHKYNGKQRGQILYNSRYSGEMIEAYA